MTTADELIAAARAKLRRGSTGFGRVGDEHLQARELLEYAAGREFDDDDHIDPETEQTFWSLIERRLTGEPVAYIRGFEECLGLRLEARPGAFVPRDSSRSLVRQAVRRLRDRKNPIAADLATGVGPVALAVAKAVPHATVYGTDISSVAIRLARRNARSNEIANAVFREGSMFEPLPRRLRGRFDVIFSHPPYVATHELGDLPTELIEFEPLESLTDHSDDGLGLVRVIISGARDWLKPGGWLCIETASDLTRRIRSYMYRAGLIDPRSTRYDGLDTRVVVAKR